ncbi:MAG: ImmA/IrrE family metallo-endopeptidase [Geobacter sp.]|nr:ImmA/IrrE family metallo-endopeptidase [Geobacter sp.]
MQSSELKFPPMSGRQIEGIACHVLRAYQPDVLEGKASFDIERFVDVHLEDLTGVQPDYLDLPVGVHGMTDQNRMIIQRLLAETRRSYKFLRSTMAHETGHAILHSHVLRKFGARQFFEQKSQKTKSGGIELFRRKDLKAYEDPEWQAWRFARALMMPEVVMRRLVQSGIRLVQIAEHFDVNVPFVESRLHDLKITYK